MVFPWAEHSHRLGTAGCSLCRLYFCNVTNSQTLPQSCFRFTTSRSPEDSPDPTNTFLFAFAFYPQHLCSAASPCHRANPFHKVSIHEMTHHSFSQALLFVHLQSNKAFLTFVKLQDFFQTKQPHSFCCPGRLKWNHFCYSDQAEALQILYSVRAESTAIFSLPIGLKPCLKIHSVTKNNVSGIWICPASQIKTLDLWQGALDGNSSALCSRHSGYLVASDGNYLQQKASVQFCMPCGVALLTLSFQTAERGNSTHTALWHKEEKSTDAKRVCSISGFLQRWKRF